MLSSLVRWGVGKLLLDQALRYAGLHAGYSVKKALVKPRPFHPLTTTVRTLNPTILAALPRYCAFVLARPSNPRTYHLALLSVVLYERQSECRSENLTDHQQLLYWCSDVRSIRRPTYVLHISAWIPCLNLLVLQGSWRGSCGGGHK